MSQPVEVYVAASQKERDELVQRLLACPTLERPETRALLLSRLMPTIQERVSPVGSALSFTHHLVDTCKNYAGALTDLTAALSYLEADSIPVRRLHQWLDAASRRSSRHGAARSHDTAVISAASRSSADARERQIPDDIDARITNAVVAWTEPINQVTELVERNKAVAVLAARQGGSHTFARQLQAHLKQKYPSWDVRRLSARPVPGESVPSYLDRMRTLMPANRPGGRLVVCIHGWSSPSVDTRAQSLSAHTEALGDQLRAYLEGSGVARAFSLIAVGSYPLYLLRYGSGNMSALNRAREIELPGLSLIQIRELLHTIDEDRWSDGDAAQVATLTGGHPHLIKTLLRARYERANSDWHTAEEQLEDDRNYLLPTLIAAAADDDIRQVLGQALESADGLKRLKFQPRWPGHYLLYEGVFKQMGKRVYFRCPVVQRLVREMFEDQA